MDIFFKKKKKGKNLNLNVCFLYRDVINAIKNKAEVKCTAPREHC